MRNIARRAPFIILSASVSVAAGCFGSSSRPLLVIAQDASEPDAEIGTGVSDATTEAVADHAAPPPPAAGGTGAFGIVTVNGKQKMYLPESSAGSDGNAFIAVVNVGLTGNGVNGAPAQITTIDLGSPNYATATGGDSTVVIAVSTQYNTIYFIDPVTDTLTGTLTLDDTYGESSFSGGGGFATGVAVDSANDRAIISVWDGFAIVSLSTKTITTVIQAPPSENFGFDSVHQRIIAPFYNCTSSSVSVDGSTAEPTSCNTPVGPDGMVMTQGLSVIDLTDNTVYTYEYPNQPDGGFNGQVLDPDQPVGGEPDSAAADPTTGVIVVPSESGGFQNIIDLSQATFDKTTKTVTAPQNVIPGLNLDGVAVEPNAHLAFWEQEFDSTVAVADLTQANMGGTVSVSGTMPSYPGGNGFENVGDPHGIAVTTAITTGGPVGFVVDSGLQWVARVNLSAMLANQQSDAAATLTDGQMASYVTFLDALTPISGPADAASE